MNGPWHPYNQRASRKQLCVRGNIDLAQLFIQASGEAAVIDRKCISGVKTCNHPVFSAVVESYGIRTNERCDGKIDQALGGAAEVGAGAGDRPGDDDY